MTAQLTHTREYKSSSIKYSNKISNLGVFQENLTENKNLKMDLNFAMLWTVTGSA